ncbi:MAG TPA: hypothetical protein VGN15_05480 [Ktedonobacteraceae bacterium]|nr:hypothetical protein [Ktedonobacteraceae bacterium]
MLLLLNQQVADYRRLDLQREVEMARLASLCGKLAQKAHRRGQQSFLSLWFNRTRLLSRRPVVLSKPLHEEVLLAEIKPALQATLSAMYREGLISDYDDTFVRQFNETFERELAHQAECHAMS